MEVKVPIDPIHKSKRGWLNVFFALVGSLGIAMQAPQFRQMVDLPQVKMFLDVHPALAFAALAFSSLVNWVLLFLSKLNVTSKNVLVSTKTVEGP